MKTINIPAPKAKFGELVWVLNYRIHRKDEKQIWETGKICGLRYENQFGGKFSWSYDVRLERIAKSGHSPTVYVDGKQIKKYKKGGNSSQD